MKSDSPPDPRPELEARLTALILGQLPEEQAAELQQQLQEDPELLRLHRRLQAAAELIREAVATADPAKSPSPVPRLSHGRREQLLASFKTIAPDARTRSLWSFKSWLVPVAAAAMILLIAAGLLPSLGKAKSRAQQVTMLAGRRLARLELEQGSAPDQTYELQARGYVSAAPKPQEPGVALTVGEIAPAPDAAIDHFASATLSTTSAGGGFGGGIAQPQGVAQAPATPPAAGVYFNINAPAPTPAAKEYGSYREAQSSIAKPQAKAEVQKQSSPMFDDEAARGKIRLTANDLATWHASADLRGYYDTNSSLALKFGEGLTATEPRKLAESSENSLGYGIALSDNSGSIRDEQLGESLAKGLPELGQEVRDDKLARYVNNLDSIVRGDKTPISEVLGREVQVARGALAAESKPANGRVELPAEKDAQLTSGIEGKSKDLGGMAKLNRTALGTEALLSDLPAARPAPPAPVPQPEILTHQNRFSTFSMNVSDVSFKLAAAALEKGVMPEAGTIRSEEFLNAFNYHDPEPASASPLAFAWEIARSPFAHNRDLIRFSVKTAAQGRQQGRPLNVVVLLDNSGSMERADRVRIIQNAFRSLSSQLQAQDRLSIVLFARTAKLWVDGVAGDQATNLADSIRDLVPQGGTNLEEAMNLAYQTALRHHLAAGINRVILLTDGAANLGDVDPVALKQKVESYRTQGIALDCFGIGSEGYNDELMESLSRNGDGRYGFINTPEEANSGFAAQLAGALQVAASDVKVQVEFNPDRVNLYRQIGYAKHQLTQEQFRDNTVDAAEIGAAESGNAMYSIEVNPSGLGPIATLRVRYKVPGTSEYKELEWLVPFNGNSPALEQASPAMKLAGTASAFSEWLAANPHAGEVTSAGLLKVLAGVPEAFPADAQPKQLEWMIRQAQSLSGK